MAFVSQPQITADGATLTLSNGVMSLVPSLRPAMVQAEGSIATSVAGDVVATLTATAGRHLVGLGFVADYGGATGLRVVLTFTDDTTETLESASVGAAARYIGNRAGFFHNTGPDLRRFSIANAAKKVKKVELKLGATVAAGTKAATIAAAEVLA